MTDNNGTNNIYITKVSTPDMIYYVAEVFAWGQETIPILWTNNPNAAQRLDHDTTAALIADFRDGCISDVLKMDTGELVAIYDCYQVTINNTGYILQAAVVHQNQNIVYTINGESENLLTSLCNRWIRTQGITPGSLVVGHYDEVEL
jgi:hypothetical protein